MASVNSGMNTGSVNDFFTNTLPAYGKVAADWAKANPYLAGIGAVGVVGLAGLTIARIKCGSFKAMGEATLNKANCVLYKITGLKLASAKAEEPAKASNIAPQKLPKKDLNEKVESLSKALGELKKNEAKKAANSVRESVIDSVNEMLRALRNIRKTLEKIPDNTVEVSNIKHDLDNLGKPFYRLLNNLDADGQRETRTDLKEKVNGLKALCREFG